MKYKVEELDVDHIGDQSGLTKEEEKAISDFINARKAKKHVLNNKKLVSEVDGQKKQLSELAV